MIYKNEVDFRFSFHGVIMKCSWKTRMQNGGHFVCYILNGLVCLESSTYGGQSIRTTIAASWDIGMCQYWTGVGLLDPDTYLSFVTYLWILTRWGRVTHICVSKLSSIGSDNGLSPGRRQAIIWANAGILLIRTLGTNFSEILCEIHSFSFSKMHLKMSSAKWRLFGLSLNELSQQIL